MNCPICENEFKEGQHYCTSCGRDLTKPVSWHCPRCFGDVTTYDREVIEYCPCCGEHCTGNFLSDDEVEAKKARLKE